MGRPKLSEESRQSAAIRLRMRPADFELMKQAADRASLSLSAWTRDRLLHSARGELGYKSPRGR